MAFLPLMSAKCQFRFLQVHLPSHFLTFHNVVQRIDSPPRGAPWATVILNGKVVYQTKQQSKMQQYILPLNNSL